VNNAIKKMNLINHITDTCQGSRNFRDLVVYKLRALRLQITVDSGGDAPKMKYRFKLPEVEITDIFRLFSISRHKLGCTFCSASAPSNQILLPLTSAALSMHDETIAEESYLLITAKLWNDAADMYFPTGIDPRIMDRVIKERLGTKHLLREYKTPYRLLAEHYVPGLLKKYGGEVAADPVNKTWLLFNHGKRRIDQIFESSWGIDKETGQRKTSSGLVLHYKTMDAAIKKKATA
jgi:hypothetical protein